MKCSQKYTFNGESLTAFEWAARLGITPHRVRQRVALGMPLDDKHSGGRKCKYYTFLWNGEIVSREKAMELVGCGKQTLYKYMDMGMSLEEIKEMLVNRANDVKAGYEEGWVTVESVAAKFGLDYSQFRYVVMSRKFETKNFVRTRGRKMSMRAGDIPAAIKELQTMVSGLVAKGKTKPVQKVVEKIKTLEEMKAEHPLVKDERFFSLTYFPKIEIFDFERWCQEEDYF